MHRFVFIFVLGLTAFGAPALAPAARPGARAEAAEGAPGLASRARQLAADVREFAEQPGFSRSKREKRIATAVRVAVVSATAYQDSTEEMLGAANQLAGAAAQAAPAYADVIVNAVAYAPPVVRAGGSVAQIRTAALAKPAAGRSAKVAKKKAPATIARATSRPAPRAAVEESLEEEIVDEPVRPASRRRVARVETEEETDERGFSREDRRARSTGDQRVGYTLSAQVGASHDDNVFRSETNKVGDTIVSLTPAVNVRWGGDALFHGNLDLSESFNRYTGKSSPNVNLGRGSLQLGYDSGSEVSASLGTSFAQLNQTNADILSSGRTTLVRTDVFSANGGFSMPLGVKTGFRLGTDYSSVDYKNGVLIGNKTLRVPLDFFYRITPKTNVSLGYAYSTQRPDGTGPHSQDHYFNLGASGEFTPKLTGNVSAGVQTRRVGTNPTEQVFAFNGNLAYELTPKVNATLALNRNFNISAIGATTTNTAVRLGLTAELSPQWQLTAGVGRLVNDYGDTVFRAGPLAGPGVLRRDHMWEASLMARYLANSWLAVSASYSLNRNSSTLAGLNYQSNLLSLLLDLSY